MIRIDEIYDNTFWPYIATNIPNTSMYFHDPFGCSHPESIHSHPRLWPEHLQNYIYLFDQEPVVFERQKSTWDEMIVRSSAPDHPKQKAVLITSEKNSEEVEQVTDYLNAKSFYYFFHGWAALDWYRGYDRTFLITPPKDRTITTTFISPNRIVGGERLHRVAMLYHFEKLGLFDNHISAPLICPVENVSIAEVSQKLSDQYPDIEQTFTNSTNFPKLFKGEQTQQMHSCWLSLFEECRESLLYHVSETVFFGRKNHLTEKTFKPIAMGMPFVITGTQGSLAYLREYGFKTFSDIWDESYDLEQDDFARLNKIANLLKELDSKSQEEKQEIFNKCVPIIEHNWNHFYRGAFADVLWHELMSMMEDIRDHLSDR